MLARTLVPVIEAGVVPPITALSIAPPLISTVARVARPVVSAVVKVPAAGEVAPIITPSMLPELASISTAPSTSNVLPAPIVTSIPAIEPPVRVASFVAIVGLPLIVPPEILGDVSVLLVSVCVSDEPTKSPVGAALLLVTAPAPAPIKTPPDVCVAAPVPPLATGSVPVTFDVRSIEPANIAFVIPSALTCRASDETSIDESSTATSSVLPLLVIAAPAVI